MTAERHEGGVIPAALQPRGARVAPFQSALLWTVGTLLAIAAVFLLRAASWITAPLAFAFFVALAVWPVDAAVRRRLPPAVAWLAHVVPLLLIVFIFAAFLLGVALAGQQIAAGLPEHRQALVGLLDRAAVLAMRTGLPLSSLKDLVTADRLLDPAVAFASSIVRSIWQAAGILTLTLFLVLFMLAEAPSLGRKVESVASRRGNSTSHSTLTTIADRFRRYLLVRAFLGLVTGGLYMLWTWAWGVDFVLVWGTLAFLLNFIPTIGSVIAGSAAWAMAILQLDAVSAIGLGAGLLLIEQVMGNYFDPRLMGRQMALSSLAVLVALMFWTWVWGALGALLAVPMTLLVVVSMAHVEALQPIALFLSSATTIEALKTATSE